MAKASLGRLVPVDLREAWQEEDSEFTPWLAQAENLKLLGDAIGLDLELEAQEKDVGPFRADILCKDQAGNWVLIENQLEATDHNHLGQLMTYAAGLKAVTIVWIAKEFREEHRAALDWLNEITEEKFSFFALEVTLWQIAGSPRAPMFRVVCQPNDWSKSVDTNEPSESRKLQLEFWKEFQRFMLSCNRHLKPTKPYSQNWMNIRPRRKHYELLAIASFFDSARGAYTGHEVRADLVLDSRESKRYFEMLAGARSAVEKEVGEPMIWRNPPKAQTCRICLRQSADLENRSLWPSYHEWLLKKLELLHKVFWPRLEQWERSSGESSGPDAADPAK